MSDAVHEGFMRRAMEVARRGWGTTHPNPMVGALIVEDGIVVAEGHHQEAGGPHAEIQALRALGRPPHKGATLYVTLEPCSSHGRTPPCTDAIVDAGITRVVAGATDPNPAHGGKGFEILRAGGVEVLTGVLADECADLNLIFNHWIACGRPLFAAKSGVTLDGKVATRSGDSKWITGEAARADGHRWRRLFPAIAVGAGTVRADNPRLTARVAEGEWCPWRFVFDGLLRTVADKAMPNLYTDEFRERTIVVTTPHGGLGYVRKLNALGVKTWVLAASSPKVNFADFRQRCAVEGITGVFFEGGAQLLSELLYARELDYLLVYHAPVLFADDKGKSILRGLRTENLEQAVRLTQVRHEAHGDDTLMRGFLSYPPKMFVDEATFVRKTYGE
ncbi:MAG TPA: bifunctional diaminohydroxyphosphoribosylaminopyrimidine deaminase/5-amino-6-(5-phosphoribosylamino)uracil reductase RibD [Lacunisphaera sp.]|jgi:diaminohydroxyphosphoribosylaminopyrimidine deaminase/5-amino-6-(5-phosphoribosylamino)uracil reductase|nr:bifunctional diaminohydroxyphosphoribosylaminopyrimidine deaminase/5-amino-6-(5-phosphoribosylamino)uracil reductase RibD [Lacunisphaera sp.]